MILTAAGTMPQRYRNKEPVASAIGANCRAQTKSHGIFGWSIRCILIQAEYAIGSRAAPLPLLTQRLFARKHGHLNTTASIIILTNSMIAVPHSIGVHANTSRRHDPSQSNTQVPAFLRLHCIRYLCMIVKSLLIECLLPCHQPFLQTSSKTVVRMRSLIRNKSNLKPQLPSRPMLHPHLRR